jgi:hypothetical protein
MSLFGYPATITHYSALLDSWNRVIGYTPAQKKAKVVEEQKEIKNSKSEMVLCIAEIHLEGPQKINNQDYFLYMNSLGETVRYDVMHMETKKEMGTDNVKKVIVYA